MTTINFAKLNDNAIIPTRRVGDGCMDVYACSNEDIYIHPHEVKLVPTGICSMFSNDYRISLRERGSNTKGTLIVMAGQIDSNYRGEWFVALYNGNDIPVIISADTDKVCKENTYIRIPMSKAVCQCAVEKIPKYNIEIVDKEYIKSATTERGDGCLGSSGK